MNLSNLKPAKGAVKKEKRIGRGQGSGHGGTSTRGNKGAGSRSGNKLRRGFEGGQMPLQRRLPKVGFKNFARVEYVVFNLDSLERIVETHKLKKIDHASLHEKKLVQKFDKIKILGRGQVKSKFDLHVHAVSAKAKEAIEKAGGSVTIIN
jgi:large subunit ribosomal protein L15